MADDSLVTALSGFTGFAAGVRDVLVPHMQAQYENQLKTRSDAAKQQAELAKEKELKAYEASIAPKTRVISQDEEGHIVGDYTGDPGQKIEVKNILKKPKQGVHLFVDKDGKVISKIPASEGSGDTVTKFGEDSEDKLSAKMRAAFPKVKGALDAVNADLDSTVATIDRILKQPGWGDAVGVKGQLGGAKIAGTPGANAAALMDSLNAKAGWDSFKDLKAASPNGSAGTGALSDSERTSLAEAAATLGRSQNAKEWARNAGIYRDRVLKTKQRANSVFNDEYGDIIANAGKKINARVKLRTGSESDTQVSADMSPKPGGVLSEDADGNKAWMYSDGTFDEVK